MKPNTQDCVRAAGVGCVSAAPRLERDGGRLGETPLPLRHCEVLALALRADASETRPYQSFDPMAGIDTSQPMSKITVPQDFPLERHNYTKNPPERAEKIGIEINS